MRTSEDPIVRVREIDDNRRPLPEIRRLFDELEPGERVRLQVRRPTLHLLVEGFVIEAEEPQPDGGVELVVRRRETPCPAWSWPADAPSRLTLILVTHNQLENVKDLLSAIRCYTTPPYELLLVDNDSSDGTRAHLELYLGEPGVRLLKNAENSQCAAATNQALAVTRTECALYLCASHALVTEPGWAEALVRFMDEHPEIPIAGHVWNPGFPLESDRYAAGWTPEGHGIRNLLHVQGGAWIARRQLFEEVGFFAQDLHPHGGMDVELSYRLISLGRELGQCPSVSCPPHPEVPVRREGVTIYHPASPELRAGVRRELGLLPPPALARASNSNGVPAFRHWRTVRGTVERLTDDAFQVRSAVSDSGLFSREPYRDVRVAGRVRYTGQAILKARIGSADDPTHDGYHVLLGGGANYLARAGHVLGHFPAPQASCRFRFTLQGPQLTLELNGVQVLTVTDTRLRAGRILLGVNHGEATYEDVAIEPLEPAEVEPVDERSKAIVFCERLDNESFCAAVVRELQAYYEVLPCGPGWPTERLADVDADGARFYLELDAASGNLIRPQGLERLDVPKLAWLIDTHKKPYFHRALAEDMDLSFYAMKAWGHVLPGRTAWLPLHADQEVFFPRDTQREHDLVFCGSHAWRAEPLERIARKHGLRLHVETTSGPREKTQTAALYAKSKLVFNRHVTNDLNFRAFEAQACGRVLLTDAQHNGQYDLFEDGRHCVLYKDEQDLERQVLQLLRDDDLRARIEREAAANAQAHHTTRARVAQLHQAIEAFLAEREPHHHHQAATRSRRILVLAGAERGTVAQRSYAEILGDHLASWGHEVTVVRQRRRRLLPERPHTSGAPRLVDVDLGPLPVPYAPNNQLLARAAPLQARLARRLAELGPFEEVLAEGPLGALVGRALAERLGVPFYMALERCEVALRDNRLTREQLHTAELEHWGVERADGVWTASEAAAAAVRRHYGSGRVSCAEPQAGELTRPEAADVERLLRRLGLSAPPSLLALMRPPAGAETPAPPPLGVLFVEDGLWHWRPDGALSCLSQRAPRGPALAALFTAARIVLTLDLGDLRAFEAQALGANVVAWRGECPPSVEDLLDLVREEVLCAAS